MCSSRPRDHAGKQLSNIWDCAAWAPLCYLVLQGGCAGNGPVDVRQEVLQLLLLSVQHLLQARQHKTGGWLPIIGHAPSLSMQHLLQAGHNQMHDFPVPAPDPSAQHASGIPRMWVATQSTSMQG